MWLGDPKSRQPDQNWQPGPSNMFLTHSSGATQIYQPMSSQYSQYNPGFQNQQPVIRQGFSNFSNDLDGELDMPPDISEIDADIRK